MKPNEYPQIKFIKSVEILSVRFNMVWNKEGDGGKFNLGENRITIGIRNYANDPLYTLSTLSHEIMEIILNILGASFQNGRTMDCFLFNFDHQVFENAIQLHTQALVKFIK